jgi:hypothetical protein
MTGLGHRLRQFGSDNKVLDVRVKEVDNGKAGDQELEATADMVDTEADYDPSTMDENTIVQPVARPVEFNEMTDVKQGK